MTEVKVTIFYDCTSELYSFGFVDAKTGYIESFTSNVSAARLRPKFIEEAACYKVVHIFAEDYEKKILGSLYKDVAGGNPGHYMYETCGHISDKTREVADEAISILEEPTYKGTIDDAVTTAAKIVAARDDQEWNWEAFSQPVIDACIFSEVKC